MSIPRKKNKEPDNTIEITHKYRAYLTALQQYRAENWFSALCKLYNQAVRERKKAYQEEKRAVSYSQQQGSLPSLKKSDPSLKMIYSQV